MTSDLVEMSLRRATKRQKRTTRADAFGVVPTKPKAASTASRNGPPIWYLTRDGDKSCLELYEKHYSAYKYADGRKRNGETEELARALAGNLMVLNGRPNDSNLRAVVADQVAHLTRVMP